MYRAPDTSDLGQRVSALEIGVQNILGALHDVSQKLDKRSETQWPVIIGFGTLSLLVIGALGTLAYVPVKESSYRIEEAVKATRDGAMTRREFDLIERVNERTFDSIMTRLERLERFRSLPER